MQKKRNNQKTIVHQLKQEKNLMLGKIEGKTRGRQRKRWLDGITNSMDMSLSEFQEEGQGGLACCNSWGRKESDMTELH